MRPRRPSRPQDEQLYRGSHRPLPRRPRVQGQARRAGREVRLPVARLPVPFSAKVYKKHPRGGGLCWGAIGARGSGSRGAPYPSPGRPTRSDAGKTPRMTRTRRFWGISPIASRTAGRDPGPDLARGIVFRPLSGSLGVPRWSSGRRGAPTPAPRHAQVARGRCSAADPVFRVPSKAIARVPARSRDVPRQIARASRRPPPRLPRPTGGTLKLAKSPSGRPN